MIRIRTLHGTLKKTLHCGVKAVNTPLTARFTVRAPGRPAPYRFSVYRPTRRNTQVRSALDKLS